MKLSIYTPENSLLVKKPVREVLVPSIKGELGILPGQYLLSFSASSRSFKNTKLKNLLAGKK